jgi:hypothetical protein
MVTRNSVSRKDGNDINTATTTKPPKRFLFDVGDYDVSVRKKKSYLQNKNYIHTQIWHKQKKVGYIDLTSAYDDVKIILSVHTMIRSSYQGLGIAYRVYEGLINHVNVAILTNNQSRGAEKLWRRFSANGSLCLYYVDDRHYSHKLFDARIYPVTRDAKDRLETVDYQERRFSPYEGRGSLLLVRKKSALDSVIHKHIGWNRQIFKTACFFKQFDEFKI